MKSSCKSKVIHMKTAIRRNFTIIFCISLAVYCASAYAKENPLMPIKLDSPRDTMRTYMEAMADYKSGIELKDKKLKNRIKDAIRCFNLEDSSFVLLDDKGPEAAILLKEVLDRVIVIDYSKIPEETNKESGVPLLRWRLKDTEITMTRVETGERTGQFLFTNETANRVREFYNKVRHLPYKAKSGKGAHFKESILEQFIPPWAKKKSLFLTNWQWMGIFLSIFLGLIIKTLVQHILSLIKKVTQKTSFQWDDKLIHAIDRPLGLICAGAFWFFTLYMLQLEGTSLTVLTVIVKIILSLSFIWLFYQAVEILSEYLEVITEKTESTLDDQLVPLLKKALKIFVIIFGILVMFQNLGVNVISVLAGLGLGGLAFALAARDMCANFFGSIMILLDRPFNIGDWVVVDGMEGTVEEIGFRSTRVRTFYDSQVTIPNSILANSNIDNMGKREFRRIKAYFGLTYNTPPEKMEAFLEGLRNIVEANPNTRKDYYHIVFNQYGDFCLQVMLYCFLKVPDWATELVERQNIYLEVLRLAKEIKVEFAFPTQTLHMDSFPGKEPIRNSSEVNEKELLRATKDFGPKGNQSKPGGLGIFTPPYRAASVSKSS